VQELFHAAAELDATEREVFLKRECGDDAALLSEVRALLDEDARGGSLLDRDLSRVARQMLDDSSVLPTQRFGPYRVLQLLGEGGMGVVYLAREVRLRLYRHRRRGEVRAQLGLQALEARADAVTARAEVDHPIIVVHPGVGNEPGRELRTTEKVLTEPA